MKFNKVEMVGKLINQEIAAIPTDYELATDLGRIYKIIGTSDLIFGVGLSDSSTATTDGSWVRFSSSSVTAINSGEVLIGNSGTDKFDRATLTGGTNVSVVNADGSITISSSHDNIAAASSSNNSDNVYIQSVTLDSNGHITAITTGTLGAGDGISYDTGTDTFNLEPKPEISLGVNEGELGVDSTGGFVVLGSDSTHAASGDHSHTGLDFSSKRQTIVNSLKDGDGNPTFVRKKSFVSSNLDSPHNFWEFDTDFSDSGTNPTSTWVVASNPQIVSGGQISNACEFDSNDALDTSSNTFFNSLLTGTGGALSLHFWLDSTATSNTEYPIMGCCKYINSSTDPTGGFEIGIIKYSDTSYDLYMKFGRYEGYPDTGIMLYTLPVGDIRGSWHFLGLTFPAAAYVDKTNMSIYYDSSSPVSPDSFDEHNNRFVSAPIIDTDVNAPLPYPNHWNSGTFIGGNNGHHHGWTYFRGKLDQIRTYDFIPNASEWNELYTEGNSDQLTIYADGTNPLLMSFADGFGVNGEVNLIANVQTNTLLDFSTENPYTKHYIYTDYNSGSPTFGTTQIKPYYGYGDAILTERNILEPLTSLTQVTYKGVYEVTASNPSGGHGAESLTDITTTLYWDSSTSGTQTTSVKDATPCWFWTVELPYEMAINGISIAPEGTTHLPNEWKIFGSITGDTGTPGDWTELDYVDDTGNTIPWVTREFNDFIFIAENTTGYRFYRIEFYSSRSTNVKLNTLKIYETIKDNYKILEGRMYDSTGTQQNRLYVGECIIGSTGYITEDQLVAYSINAEDETILYDMSNNESAEILHNIGTDKVTNDIYVRWTGGVIGGATTKHAGWRKAMTMWSGSGYGIWVDRNTDNLCIIHSGGYRFHHGAVSDTSITSGDVKIITKRSF